MIRPSRPTNTMYLDLVILYYISIQLGAHVKMMYLGYDITLATGMIIFGSFS